jgi:glycosyltransferase involved in cell wall biosynthesis
VKIALVTLDRSSGSAHYRTELPLRHLAPVLAADGIELMVPDPWHDLDDADVAIFYRAFTAHAMPIPLKRFIEGRPTWWDTDDLFPSLPKWNPVHKELTPLDQLAYLECLHLSRGITVSTQPLADATGHAEKCVVLPNLADLDDWSCPRGSDDRLTVAWAGSVTHQEDLRVIVPALRAARREFGERLSVLMLGFCPDYLRTDDVIRPLLIGGGPIWSYPGVLRRLAPDVTLAPLSKADDAVAFNRCKSGIKWIEGTLAGSVVIAHDLDPYRDVIEPGVTGWLCDSEDAWTETLLAVLHDRNGRRSTLHEARQAVEARHSWQSDDARQTWLDWFRSLVLTPAEVLS